MSLGVEEAQLNDAAPGRQFIAALARGLDILRAFREGDPALSNQELARRTGLPRPTISRITYTLTELGYLVHQQKHGSYQLGGRALVLGHVARANFNIAAKVRPAMQRLAEFSGANVGLGGRDKLNMVYLEAATGPSLIGLRLNVGEKIPLLTTAMGRAFLAIASDKEIVEITREFKQAGRPELEDIPRVVAAARAEYSRLGFCLSTGDWQDDIHGVAAPVRASEVGGSTVVNCGGPAFLLPKTLLLQRIGPEVAAVANEITDILGEHRKPSEAARSYRTGRRAPGHDDLLPS